MLRHRLQVWPPGIDILPGAIEAFGLRVEVIVQRAATPGLGHRGDTDAQTIQHPRRGVIGIWRQPRLYAAFNNNTRRACRGAGREPLTGKCCGNLLSSKRGNSGRNVVPTRNKPLNNPGLGANARKPSRNRRCAAGRGTA